MKPGNLQGSDAPAKNDLEAPESPPAEQPRPQEPAKRAGARKQGKTLNLSNPAPWPEPVIGPDLAEDLRQTFDRYLVLPPGADTALALWVLHAHALEAADNSPLLVLTSPEKRCGKTTTLRLLNSLVPRPLSASNLTTSVIFRVLEMAQPTLLIDEADTFLGNKNEEMRGVINSGHTRNGHVYRSVGDDFEPREFSTWGAKAIAKIGEVPDTIEDRAIVVVMRRKLGHEEKPRIERADLPGFEALCRRAWTWSCEHVPALTDADPTIPHELNDRAADNWRPLLAIADALGSGWPEFARDAALTLSNGDGASGSSDGVRALADIRALFSRTGAGRLPTQSMLNAMHELDESPWAEWKAGKPLSGSQLARLLKPFGVQPGSFRDGATTFRGYELTAFRDAFERYLPAATTSGEDWDESEGDERNGGGAINDDLPF